MAHSHTKLLYDTDLKQGGNLASLGAVLALKLHEQGWDLAAWMDHRMDDLLVGISASWYW